MTGNQSISNPKKLSRFSRGLLISAGLVVVFVIAFGIYVRSEKELDRTNESRHLSFLLADELRQSSDDLTHMVQSYVVTGNPVYKQNYQDILDIRNGKKPRPVDYWRIYWDLVPGSGQVPRPASRQAVSLLELMRQAGYTQDEFRKLAEANANSDKLTLTELEAMKLAESAGPEAGAEKTKARMMIFDDKYHQAKAGIMKPIDDFYVLLDTRTRAAVKTDEHQAATLRYLFITFGLMLLFMLWRTYMALQSTLGGSVDEVYTRISSIGSGDFSSFIPVNKTMKNSVLGWLAETHLKLKESEDVRKQAEAEKQESEEKFKAMANLLPQIVFESDLQGQLTYVNKHAFEILKYPENFDLKDFNTISLYIPEDRPRAIENIHRRMAGKQEDSNEYTIMCYDGSMLKVLVYSNPIIKDHKPVGLRGIIVDITQLKKAEDDLRESEALYRAILDASPDDITITDSNGRLLMWSPSAQKMFGYESDAGLKGRLIFDFIAPEYRELAISRFALNVQGLKTGPNEYMALRADGSTFDFEVNHGQILNAEGQVSKLVFIGRDITERKLAGKALQKSEEMLREAGRLAKMGGWELDLKTKDLTWTDETYRIHEVSKDGTKPGIEKGIDFYAPEAQPVLLEAIERAQTDGIPYDLELPFITASGRRLWVRTIGNAERSDGQTVRLSGIFQDITEHKQIQDALHKSKKELNQILQTTDQGIYGIDTVGNCTFINQSGINALGFQNDECIGRNMHDLIHHSHSDGSPYDVNQCPIFKAKATGMGTRIENEVLWRKDGSSFPAEYSSYPIFENGDIAGAVITFSDITGRKHAEKKLVESEAKYRLLTEFASDVIWVLNLSKGEFTYISPAIFQLRGLTVEEAMNEKFDASMAPGFVDIVGSTISAEVQKFIANPSTTHHYIHQVQQPCKDGSLIWVEISLKYRYSSFGDIEVVGLSRNIDERKKMEKEIRKSEADLQQINSEKDKYFSIIAHDLRSPLSAFMGLTQIMAEKLPQLTMDEVQKIAVSMRTSANNLFRLLENLLHWARIEQGLIPFEPLILHLSPVIDESISMVVDQARNKGVEMDVSVPEDISVVADINMLQTIIRNLVSNAVKFTPKGGTVTLSAIEAGDKNVEISVRDTGIGMSDTILDNLFHIHVQTSRKGTANEPSTGLGLSICKEFIEKHGGELRITSEVGKGSTFSFMLPRSNQEVQITEDMNSIPVQHLTKPAKTLKILIAEDDETSGMLLAIALKPFSNEILKASNGAEAIRACKNNPNLDLIMMDIKMPGMDGYEATMQIRKFNTDVLIIAQSAFGQSESREKAIEAGCNDFIAKPVEVSLLLQLIKKHFKIN